MTETTKYGRPITYPLRGMAVNEAVQMDVPTAADVKRIARNVSQYGQRHKRFYRCNTDRAARVMTITRIV